MVSMKDFEMFINGHPEIAPFTAKAIMRRARDIAAENEGVIGDEKIDQILDNSQYSAMFSRDIHADSGRM